MSVPASLLAIVAHPDDESFGCGSVLAEAAARGLKVSICAVTLGELGDVRPGHDLEGRSLAECRWDELRSAATLLGVECLPSLGLTDSGWDGPAATTSLCGVPFAELIDRVGTVIAATAPDIVLTIAGDDGHRDHLRLRDAITAAFPRHAPSGASLYVWCLPNGLMRRWADEIAVLRPTTAHLALADLGTKDEEITTVIDTSARLPLRRAAIAAHASQTSPYDGLSADLEQSFLTRDFLIQVFPTPAPGMREDWFRS